MKAGWPISFCFKLALGVGYLPQRKGKSGQTYKIHFNGRRFIEHNYSVDAVTKKIYSIFDNLEKYPTKRMNMLSRKTGKLVQDFKYQFDRHLAWRINYPAANRRSIRRAMIDDLHLCRKRRGIEPQGIKSLEVIL